jgi:predicted MFS family arabinose efflux permease
MKTRASDQSFVLIILFTVSLVGELDYQIIPPLLPLLAPTFQIEAGYAGRVVPLYAISAGLFSLLFGYLSDQHGRKPFIQYGLLGFSAAALLTSFASTIELLYLSRFLTGMATGAFTTSATSYAADFFRYEHRGRAMGILSAAYFASAIIGIPVVTAVAAKTGWRPIFWAISGIAIFVSLLVWQFLQLRPHSASQPPGSPDRLGIGQLTRILVRSMKRPETSAILLASLLSSGAIVGFTTYFFSHLNRDLFVPINQAGRIFLWAGLPSLMGAPLAGVLADRLGKKVLLVVSGLALTFCLLVIPRLPLGTWLFACLGLAGFAIAFRMAPLLSLLTELVTPHERGTLLALRNALSQVGIAASTFVSSYLYVYAGYRAVGFFSAALVIVSTLLVLFLISEPIPARPTREIPQH